MSVFNFAKHFFERMACADAAVAVVVVSENACYVFFQMGKDLRHNKLFFVGLLFLEKGDDFVFDDVDAVE